MKLYEAAKIDNSGAQDANGARVHWWLLVDGDGGNPSYVPKWSQQHVVADTTNLTQKVVIDKDIEVIPLDILCEELGIASCLENWNLLCYILQEREDDLADTSTLNQETNHD